MNGYYTDSFQFGTRRLFLILSVVSMILAAGVAFYRSFIEPRRISDEIQSHLRTLATRRPQSMTPHQWEAAVAWTSNLHGNSSYSFLGDPNIPAMRAFERRLAQKLEGHVDMQTIDWIWDEYAELCECGADYQKFRPQMYEEISSGQDWGYNIR